MGRRSPYSATAQASPTMSTAMWMNERITKENRMFPPDQAERPKDSPPRKTHRDAFAFEPHGHASEEEWLMARREDIWKNNGISRTAASARLKSIHSFKVKNDPHLLDPKRPEEEVAALMEIRACEKQKKIDEAEEVKIFGRPKSEEVAFSERMQGFKDLTRA